jgi:hypothetical protein
MEQIIATLLGDSPGAFRTYLYTMRLTSYVMNLCR